MMHPINTTNQFSPLQNTSFPLSPKSEDKLTEQILEQLIFVFTNHLFKENEEQYASNHIARQEIKGRIRNIKEAISKIERTQQKIDRVFKIKVAGKLINRCYFQKQLSKHYKLLEKNVSQLIQLRKEKEQLCQSTFFRFNRARFLGKRESRFYQDLHSAESSPLLNSYLGPLSPLLTRRVEHLKKEDSFCLESFLSYLDEDVKELATFIRRRRLEETFIQCLHKQDCSLPLLYTELFNKASNLEIAFAFADKKVVTFKANRCALESQMKIIKSYDSTIEYIHLSNYSEIKSDANYITLEAVERVFHYLQTLDSTIIADGHLLSVIWLCETWGIKALQIQAEKALLKKLLKDYIQGDTHLLFQINSIGFSNTLLIHLTTLLTCLKENIRENIPCANGATWLLLLSKRDLDHFIPLISSTIHLLKEYINDTDEKKELYELIKDYFLFASKNQNSKLYRWCYTLLNSDDEDLTLPLTFGSNSYLLKGNLFALKSQSIYFPIYKNFHDTIGNAQSLNLNEIDSFYPISSTFDHSFKCLLNYLKTLEISLDTKHVVEILYLSDYFFISKLKKECSQFIAQKIFKEAWEGVPTDLDFLHSIYDVKSNKQLLAFPLLDSWLSQLIEFICKTYISSINLIDSEAYSNPDLKLIRIALLELLAEHGATSLIDYWFQTPSLQNLDSIDIPNLIRIASHHNQLETLEFLFQKSMFISTLSSEQWGLKEAIENGHLNAVKFLLFKKATISDMIWEMGSKPLFKNNSLLFLALINKQKKVAEYLMDKEPVTLDCFNLAVQNGYLKVIKHLIEKDKDQIIGLESIQKAYQLVYTASKTKIAAYLNSLIKTRSSPAIL